MSKAKLTGIIVACIIVVIVVVVVVIPQLTPAPETTIVLSPVEGHVGMDLTFTGSGFAIDDEVVVMYEGDEAATATTDDTGRLEVVFAVPKSRWGARLVTAKDGEGNEASAIFIMESDAPPVPELVSPADGERVDFVDSFEWSEVEDPSGVYYSLQVSASADRTADGEFVDPIVSVAGLADPSYTLEDEALSHGTYYWIVQAVDGAENESWWTDVYSFDDRSTIYLVSPQASATNVAIKNVSFIWSSLAEVDYYNWVLSPNADLSDPVEIKERLTYTAYTFTGTLAYDTPYYWQVTAYKDGSAIAASAIGTFRTMTDPDKRTITVSSTGGGAVTAPGEGTFRYDEGTVVNLVAEADEGYLFLRWTGDVASIADVNADQTTITMERNYTITASFGYDPQKVQVGVKAGDWIKVEYTITGWPPGEPYPEWLKMEFLSVEGTSINVRVTMAMSDGTEQSDTVPVDVVAGSGEAFGLSGLVIPANLSAVDYVYMTGYGDIAIEGETTRTYAGEERTVVCASYSKRQSAGGLWEFEYDSIDYWDKLTGVMVEGIGTYTDTLQTITVTFKATETNMWGADPTKARCFIATAAYGTAMAEEIQVLREFRDAYLLTNPIGQAFVEFYYRTSPPIARFITEHPGLKPIVKAGLVPAIGMSTIVVNTSPTEKAGILGLLVLVCVAVAVWAARRRGKLKKRRGCLAPINGAGT